MRRRAFRLLMWTARALLAWWLIGWSRPAPPRLIEEPLQGAPPAAPLMCVHTRLIDEVDEWKIARSLRLAREMGAGAIVEFFPWAYIEGEPGADSWVQADRIVNAARRYDLRVIARVGLVPAWARENAAGSIENTTLNTLPREQYAAFGAFVARLAARYAGTIEQIIVWNEPNLAFEWGYQQIDPAGYAELLRAVYPPVKAANPQVKILAAGLAPTLEPEGSAAGLDDRVYLERLYAAGAAASFDGLAVHTYGFTHPPEQDPAPDRLNFRRAELLRAVMVANGDGDTPVYITESGWNDHPRWTQAVTPARRIAYTIGAYEWARQHWDWARKLCVWSFRMPADTFRYPDDYTLVTVDFQLKPIYHALYGYARGETRPSDLWLPAPVSR